MYRDPQSRLKLYIPAIKFAQWEKTLYDIDPNSLFFTNFNQWVRNSIRTLPDPSETPLYPLVQNSLDGEILQKNGKHEKSLWIATKVKNALKIKKGHLSLNAYIILILDLTIFESSKFQMAFSKILKLEERIQKLETRLEIVQTKSK
ncbi:MAG: hypothetical protein ACTSYI_04175 [Promethearchaeota archaeon]